MTGKTYGFEKLEIWGLASSLIQEIYESAMQLPKTEMFGLGDQMRRAVVSVALNIAEGRAADTDAEFRRFLGISLKSLVEVVACLKISQSLGFMAQPRVIEICSQCDRLEAKLRAFRGALQRQTKTGSEA